MSHITMNIHNVTAIRVGEIQRSPKGAVWRDVVLETANGESFCITAFPEDKSDSLEPMVDSEEQREAG